MRLNIMFSIINVFDRIKIRLIYNISLEKVGGKGVDAVFYDTYFSLFFCSSEIMSVHRRHDHDSWASPFIFIQFYSRTIVC